MLEEIQAIAKLNVKSAPVRKASSKRLAFSDLEDVFFFEPMYSNFSEGDNKEGYIKLKAFVDPTSMTSSNGDESQKV